MQNHSFEPEDLFLNIINLNLKLDLKQNDLKSPQVISQSILIPFLSDEKKLDEVSKRSYIHLNGFKRLVLFESEDKDIQIRLHVWDEDFKQNKQDDSDIHDHRWSFISYPIQGQFQERKFIEQSGGKFYEKYHCYPRTNLETAFVELNGISALHEITSKIIETSELNYCDSDEIHQLNPTKLPAMTLLITYNPNKKFARAFKEKSNFDKENDVLLPNLPISEIKKIINYTIEKIVN